MNKNELVVNTNPKSVISESIKTLRTNLQFASVDEKLKTLLFTSSMPGEGKSFVAANLAVAFAQNGNKVLIIDGDLRKGRQHEIWNLSNSLGLSNLLIDDINNYKNYIQKTNVVNVSLLTAGIIPPNPSELLGSDKNKQLISLLEEQYDIIIIDCVPINGLTDSLIMSKIVDKTIIVCAFKVTQYEMLDKTTKTLQNIDANIAGIIVNKVPVDDNSYYDKYYSNYN